MPNVKKTISPNEKEFARLMVDVGLGYVHAARKAFGWKCEPKGQEVNKARDLAHTPRLLEYMEQLKKQIVVETTVENIITESGKIEWDKLRAFAYERLREIRNNNRLNAQVRYNAVEALEKLEDPNKDINLIWKWVDLVSRGMLAHCPCCHETFPLWKVDNPALSKYRKKEKVEEVKETYDVLERRMEIISRMDRRKQPHAGQIQALAAPERHVAGLGPARAGKSLVLAWFAATAFLIPGVEIWILARVYDDARSEVDYIKGFLNTLFFPNTRHLFSERFDSKTGELTIISRWGSELKIRSAKAKGSITGRELEFAGVAEPGWVPEDLYEEIRARMSSRLGRIVVFGTPKGFGGFLGRMINMTGRDPKTGKVIRKTPAERLISAGCPWNTSMLTYTLSPVDNPEYVKSELDAARQELTDVEYESEFEGRMTSQEGQKFGHIRLEHCKNIDRNIIADCNFILGVDQGERNFGAVVAGWDGEKVYVIREYFENGDNTIRTNMKELMQQTPIWIKQAGGQPDEWKLTIFDRDPPIWNIIGELEQEGTPWPTDWVMRHKNKKVLGDNWRKETTEFINEMARAGRLIFEREHCDLLHDQLMRAIDKPMNDERDRESDSNKGWIINDPWRGDHVCDAFMVMMWTIFSNMVVKVDPPNKVMDPYAEAKAGFDYLRAMDERHAMAGLDGRPVNEGHDIWEKTFGRSREKKNVEPKRYGYYSDYS